MKTGKLWRNLRFAGIAAATFLIGAVRDAFALLAEGQAETNRLGAHESDLTGDYNYRTGRLDDGTDPYGWYERD